MRLRPHTFLLCLLLLLLFIQGAAQEAPRYERLRYRSLHWQSFHTPSFHLYFPQGCDSLAKFITTVFPDAQARVRKGLMATGEKEPQILVYPSPGHLYESNVGGDASAPATLPTFISKGNRILLPFRGSYRQLEEDLRLGLAYGVWAQWFGAGLAEQLRNTYRQNDIPRWYHAGTLRFLVLGWTADEERTLYELLERKTMQQIMTEEPALWGNAFSYYLGTRYYPQAPQQVLFQVRKKKSLARGLRLIVKQPLDTVLKGCEHFYRDRAAQMPPVLKPEVVDNDSLKLPGKLLNVVYSPDTRSKVLLTETDHHRDLWLYHHQQRKRLLRYALPPWQAEHQTDPYPLVVFEANKYHVILPHKGKLLLNAYELTGKLHSSEVLPAMDGVLQFRPLDRRDHSEIVLNAWKQGQSDLLHYDARRRKLLPLTNDWYDDGAFEVLGLHEGVFFEVLFRSNRRLPADTGKNARSLPGWYRLTEGNTNISRIRVDTPASRFYNNGEIIAPAAPWLIDYQRHTALRAREDSLLQAARDTSASFLSGVFGNAKQAAQRQKDSLEALHCFDARRVKPYVLQLYSAYFSAQVNNEYYINRYQPYQNYQGQYKFPEAGAQAKGGFSDLFGNHHFSIGYRMPAGSDGSDFFVAYRNSARRTEWGLSYFRKVEQTSPDPYRNWTSSGKRYPNAGKVKTHYYELSLHHPLSWYSALHFSTALRYDRSIFTATDLGSLRFEDLAQSWSLNSLSYTLDKRLPLLLGLYKGFSGKAGIDGFSGVNGGKGTTLGLYAKLEYHQPLYKGINLATRLQGGYSAGTGRILYTMGGVDGNLSIRTDTTVHFRQDAPYVFQSLVTPLRGYRQNSLYGDRCALLNVDVYVPLFAELIPLKTSLPSINHLQVGVFGDVAGASENYKGAVAVGDEWLYALGVSARTLLAGYPLRFDMGWPGSGGKPVWYLSIKL